ncbi:MAG: hypothetical protein CM1200mP1_09990 [Candidatus Neomarinimicrobiota bacterium]|nr:MAG: hypothetical protein CM1200mP1_09990 [Candidatus Neomarinimicrobiota bacterium]
MLREKVVKHMKNAMDLDVPIEIDFGVGSSWYEAH